MTKFTNEQCNKAANGTLSHEEWNQAASNINDLIDASGNAGGGSVSSSIAANLELTGGDGNNMTIKSAKHLNLEPSYKVYDAQNQTWSSDNEGDLQLKPGDDIAFYSHHRSADKRDEVSLKVLDGADKPVKLLIQAGEITLQAKLKNLTKKKDTTTGEDNAGTTDADYLYKDDQANVFDINVTTEYKPNRGSGSKKTGKGYLKVRAQAIDLRCEANGGIALQPKGEDSDHHMNKIKFEHGGGDGLEFGTFNTEHTSLFTEDYRFNKNGVVKLATRTTELSDKYDGSDETTHYKYVKNQNDDFYDNIDSNDPTCTWEDIVRYIAWAKDNLQGPFDLSTYINSRLESQPGKITFVFPSGRGPETSLEFAAAVGTMYFYEKSTGNGYRLTGPDQWIHDITFYGNDDYHGDRYCVVRDISDNPIYTCDVYDELVSVEENGQTVTKWLITKVEFTLNLSEYNSLTQENLWAIRPITYTEQ